MFRRYVVPTIQQLVRKGRAEKTDKTSTPASSSSYDTHVSSSCGTQVVFNDNTGQSLDCSLVLHYRYSRAVCRDT